MDCVSESELCASLYIQKPCVAVFKGLGIHNFEIHHGAFKDLTVPCVFSGNVSTSCRRSVWGSKTSSFQERNWCKASSLWWFRNEQCCGFSVLSLVVSVFVICPQVKTRCITLWRLLKRAWAPTLPHCGQRISLGTRKSPGWWISSPRWVLHVKAICDVVQYNDAAFKLNHSYTKCTAIYWLIGSSGRRSYYVLDVLVWKL